MKDKLSELIHRHKLPAFLVAVVILAGVLVVISVSVYYRSGAYQLDLSRPEYKDVRSQIEKDKKVNDLFDAQGPVDEATLNDFLKQYQEEADKALEADAFGTEPLPQDSRLRRLPNAILTPHIAWTTKEALQRLMDITTRNLRTWLEGSGEHIVNG